MPPPPPPLERRLFFPAGQKIDFNHSTVPRGRLDSPKGQTERKKEHGCRFLQHDRPGGPRLDRDLLERVNQVRLQVRTIPQSISHARNSGATATEVDATQSSTILTGHEESRRTFDANTHFIGSRIHER